MLVHLDQVFATVRTGPSIAAKETVALAGEVYFLFREVYEESPKDPNDWACLKGLNRAVRQAALLPRPCSIPTTRMT